MSENNLPVIEFVCGLKSPVPIAIKIIIKLTLTILVAPTPIKYPADIKAIPTGTRYFAPTNLSEIIDPNIGAAYVHATKFAVAIAPCASLRPIPPSITFAATNCAISHFAE